MTYKLEPVPINQTMGKAYAGAVAAAIAPPVLHMLNGDPFPDNYAGVMIEGTRVIVEMVIFYIVGLFAVYLKKNYIIQDEDG